VKPVGTFLRSSVPFIPVFLLCAILSAPAPAAGEPQGSDGAARLVTAITMPEGVVALTLPPNWEMNPRLAKDNGAPGFLHPSGTPVGQDLPFWVIVDRCPRASIEKFPALVARVLEEGKPYDFVLQDSTGFRTSDGRRAIQCTFKPSKSGAMRGLAFVEAPVGALLFRYQARDEKMWEDHRRQVAAIIRTVRFLETQKDSKGSPGK
jgi:hypothetical protein